MNMLIKVALLICFISATQCTNSNHTISKRQVASSVCSTNTCRYGQCEIVSTLSFRCHCNAGITGQFCDTQAPANNPCSSNPCWNGATCTNLSFTTFRCTCPAGFEGPQCRALTGACQCLNGGQCIPVAASTGLIAYRCNCPAAFGGNRCEFVRSAFASCQTVGCQNNGYCTIFSTCVCQPGFTGQFCQTATAVTVAPVVNPFLTTANPLVTNTFALNVCAPGICLNGGTCFQITTSLALCSCRPGFSGVFCNIGGGVVNPVVNPVFPVTTLSPTVVTVAPVIGTNFCTVNPCLNGGACTPTTGTLGRCICPSAFTGVLCETGYTCANLVCPVGQQCVITNNIPACQVIIGK